MGRSPDAPRVHGTFVPVDGKMELTELDWAILRLLPPPGAKIGKYILDARSTPEVRRELADNALTSGVIAGRMRWLRAVGYATPVSTPGRGSKGKGWQQTKEGVKALAEKDGPSQA